MSVKKIDAHFSYACHCSVRGLVIKPCTRLNPALLRRLLPFSHYSCCCRLCARCSRCLSRSRSNAARALSTAICNARTRDFSGVKGFFATISIIRIVYLLASAAYFLKPRCSVPAAAAILSSSSPSRTASITKSIVVGSWSKFCTSTLNFPRASSKICEP